MSLLSYIIILPLALSVALLVAPKVPGSIARRLSEVLALVVAGLGVYVFWGYHSAPVDEYGYRFVQSVEWVGSLGIHYAVGVDGINVGLVLMSALVYLAAVFFAPSNLSDGRLFFGLLNLMAAGIVGCFAATDLFFFYFFHELALVPSFIMIGKWGNTERKGFAAFHLTIYLTVGALLALVGLTMLYVGSGGATFSIPELTRMAAVGALNGEVQKLAFPLLMFGFGILVSLWPFHTWAPVGYGNAPSSTAILHAGALKKFGLYGLIRVAVPLAPEGASFWLQILAVLCLGNLLWVGFVAMKQQDLNGLISNSSVAHMGFVFLGISTFSVIGVTGSVVVMVAHGLLAALCFGLSGYMKQHGGCLSIASMGGILRSSPRLGWALMVAFLAGCGVPGFANFAGELLTLVGAWKTAPDIVVGAAWSGLIIGAVYMFRAIRRILHGSTNEVWSGIKDLSGGPLFAASILGLGLALFGIVPGLLTDVVEPSVAQLTESVSGVLHLDADAASAFFVGAAE